MGSNFKILSIDGGGIKGLYSARILENIEKKFDCRVSDYFDLICGTSTGGLIALALSLKIPASQIATFYVEEGPKIFPKQNIVTQLFKQILFKGKFNNKQLKKVLIDLFGDSTLSESNNIICLPSYSLVDARPWVFKYHNSDSDYNRDNDTTYVDVALSTSAAPTYLPIFQIPHYDNRLFIDGGIWANNPSLVGLLEALRFFVGQDKDYKKIDLLSISSLSMQEGTRTDIWKKRPFIMWRNDLFEASLNGQSFFNDFFMSQLSKSSSIPVHYYRIPSEEVSKKQASLISLDNTKKSAIDLINAKGNDRGIVEVKKSELGYFFKNKKSYKIY